MCKIWSIIYECRHKNNATLSTCNGRRKYYHSTSQACMKSPTLRVHLAGTCAACRKHATDKRLDYESKVIDDYFANPPAKELRPREILDAERLAMLEDVERRRVELTGELPLGNGVRSGRFDDWMGKTDPSKPWGSKRRATWRLSALANEVLPEYIAEPEPNWATKFAPEESADEREKREADATKMAAAGIVDWAAEAAKADADDDSNGVWEINDWTEQSDDDDIDMSSDSSDNLAEQSDDIESAQYKDLDEDMEDHLTAPEPGAEWIADGDDSGFVSDDSDDNGLSEKTDLRPTNTPDHVDAMDWFTTSDYANFHSEVLELNSPNPTTSSDSLSPFDIATTPSELSSQCPATVAPHHDNNVSTDNPSTNPTNENNPHTTSILNKPTSACLMEVEGVKCLIGDRPEQANPWQWSRSACSPKTKSGRSFVIRW